MSVTVQTRSRTTSAQPAFRALRKLSVRLQGGPTSRPHGRPTRRPGGRPRSAKRLPGQHQSAPPDKAHGRAAYDGTSSQSDQGAHGAKLDGRVPVTASVLARGPRAESHNGPSRASRCRPSTAPGHGAQPPRKPGPVQLGRPSPPIRLRVSEFHFMLPTTRCLPDRHKSRSPHHGWLFMPTPINVQPGDSPHIPFRPLDLDST